MYMPQGMGEGVGNGVGAADSRAYILIILQCSRTSTATSVDVVDAMKNVVHSTLSVNSKYPQV